MIRFIIKHTFQHEHNGLAGENFTTIDGDVPQLESVLRNGGYSELAHDAYFLIGAEIRDDEEAAKN